MLPKFPNVCEHFPQLFFSKICLSMEISFLVTLVLAMFVKPYILHVWLNKDLYEMKGLLVNVQSYDGLKVEREDIPQRNTKATKAKLGRDCT